MDNVLENIIDSIIQKVEKHKKDNLYNADFFKKLLGNSI
jgi:hypothetical protein